jgi:hypothetical protein
VWCYLYRIQSKLIADSYKSSSLIALGPVISDSKLLTAK